MRKVLYHSRRSFSGVVSKAHASLLAMSCASAAVMDLKLKNTVFEFSYSEAVDALNNPLESGLLLVPDTCNRAASAIADSITRDQRLQSYIATGGPRWLSDLLSKEASAC
ncbi:hypothetical protein F2Q69_00020784 [Brassica cretica]|uniref:Uncharacterized protein n=1 Tax=Brassica cretica TaxID=69181 RepID=A0A8S9PZQ3_BRACR|nr:hypothetical protein F2Q69_00020784 [Brassica cretica]